MLCAKSDTDTTQALAAWQKVAPKSLTVAFVWRLLPHYLPIPHLLLGSSSAEPCHCQRVFCTEACGLKFDKTFLCTWLTCVGPVGFYLQLSC